MMKATGLLVPAMAVVLSINSGAAFGQALGARSASDTRCSQLQGADISKATAVIYYISGFDDAQRQAMSAALGGIPEGPPATRDQPNSTGSTAAGQPNAGGAQGSSPPASGAKSVPGTTITLSAEQVITACSQSPDSRIVDIITSQGGSGFAFGGTPNATEPAVTNSPAGNTPPQ
jgi:hypothetical protein